MKNKEEKISAFASITGIIAALYSFVHATNLLDKINKDLFIGILASVLASGIVYIIYYLKDINSELSKTRYEIELMRISIRQLVAHTEKKSVFISYSHEDKNVADKISKELEKANLVVWDYAKEIKPGENWYERIQKAVSETDYFIYLISKNNSKSEYLSKELELALQKNKRVLPILVDESKPERAISSIKYINLKDDYLEGVEELLKTFKLELEGQVKYN